MSSCLRRTRPFDRLILMLLALAIVTIACASASEPVAEPTFADQAPQEEAPAALPTVGISPTEGLPSEDSEGERSSGDPPSEVPADTKPISLIPERRLLSFEWPNRIRTGDSDIIRISLEIDEAGQLTPTAFFGEHELATEVVEIENLYETHLVTAEARLDMVGLSVEPAGTIRKRLFPGESVDFSWSVSPTSDGSFRGTIWLFLRYTPFEDGDELEKVIFSRPLQIDTVNILGLGGRPARVLGAIGTAVGSLLGLDDIFKWLRRLRKRR